MKSLLICMVVCATLAMGASLPATPLPRDWKRVTSKAGELNLNEVQKMTIGLKRNNMKQLDSIFWDVSNPESENYGEHLKHEQMRDLISVGPTGLAKVTGWLKANGIDEYTVARHEDAIAFDLSAAKVEQLLSVKFKTYQNTVNKRRVNRAVSKVMIPEAIAPFVEVISGHRGFPFVLNKEKKNVLTKNLGSESQNVTPKLLYKMYRKNYMARLANHEMQLITLQKC